MKNLITKKEIKEKIEEIIQSRKEIVFAYIFGSFKEKENFNDIDLGVYLDESIKEANNIFYEIELSNQIEEKIKIPVDIIKLNSASDPVAFIVTQGILIKNIDDNLRTNFVTASWKRYWDYQKLIQEYIREIKSDSRYRKNHISNRRD
ncbi:MAG: nucleotidyltransferase domain-containing protein [Candidatus Atribacteria bacterium]|nr:nucleotidyltransferase domain-containing protein [Candidatus Atribacteria bacterium]